MTEKPLNEYIDMEAYDVVSGDSYRALLRECKALEQFEDDVRDVMDMMSRSEFYKPLNDALARLMRSRS